MARALQPVRCWHRSECERLALSPKLKVEQHWWRENYHTNTNSTFFKLAEWYLYVAFGSEAFFGFKNASKLSASGTKKSAANGKRWSKIDCRRLTGMVPEV